jgi:hypothetical protein
VIDRAARSSTGGALVAVVAQADDADIERIARLRSRFGSVTIVRFDRSCWEARAPAPTAPRGDGVLLVTRDTPFPAAWNRTMGGRRRASAVTAATNGAAGASRGGGGRSDDGGPDDDRWARHARILG